MARGAVMKTLALAVIALAVSTGSTVAKADNFRSGSCVGILALVPPDAAGRARPDAASVPDFYQIEHVRGIGHCNIPSTYVARVLQVCEVGHHCQVRGKINDCEGAPHCVEL